MIKIYPYEVYKQLPFVAKCGVHDLPLLSCFGKNSKSEGSVLVMHRRTGGTRVYQIHDAIELGAPDSLVVKILDVMHDVLTHTDTKR